MWIKLILILNIPHWIFSKYNYQALLLCKKEMIYRDAGVAVRHALSGNTSGGAGTDRGITQWCCDTAH